MFSLLVLSVLLLDMVTDCLIRIVLDGDGAIVGWVCSDRA